MGRAISFQYDAISKNLLVTCADRAAASPPATRPICVQDGARVQTIDGLRSVWATSANFVSFERRRIRRRADGQPVVITVVMLRGMSKGPEL